MKKLDKLTKKQKALVPVYLKKWLDNGHKVDRIDKKKAEESIAEIYRICGKKAPKHYFHFPSPIQCQLAVNILKNSKDKDFKKLLESNLWSNLESNLGNNLWSNLGSNLESNLRSNLESNLGNNLWSNLWSNLGNNLWSNLGSNLESNLRSNLESNLGNNLWSNLWSNLRNNLRSNLGNNLGSNLWNNLRSNLWSNLGNNLGSNLWSMKLNYENCFFGNYWTWWVGFYDFILNELFQDKIPYYQDFKSYINCLQNVHIFIPYEDIVFISDYPEEIKLNNQGQLHDFDKPAMRYTDGYSLFYINGQKMPKHIIETPREQLSPQEILKIANVDERVRAIAKIGANRLIEKLGATVIDTQTYAAGGEYQLLKVNWTEVDRYYLKMINPSINEIHIESVHPDCRTVEQALGYRVSELFGDEWSKKDYKFIAPKIYT